MPVPRLSVAVGGPSVRRYDPPAPDPVVGWQPGEDGQLHAVTRDDGWSACGRTALGEGPSGAVVCRSCERRAG